MWSFQKLFFTLCSALSCVRSAAGLIRVFGYEGIRVNISCSYPQGYETYEKYLCRNDCADSDVLITTLQTNKHRHSIYDDKSTRIFTTTISNLQSADAGKYWCGVSRNGKDLYTELKLETKQDSCCSTVNNIQGNEGGSVTISCPYDSESDDKLKFLCRGNRPSTCRQQAVITSNNTQNGRFRLSDDRKSRIFTVTISSLTLKDSGSYLCGVQRNSGFDVFSAVELEVKVYEHQSSTVKTIITTTPPASEEQAKGHYHPSTTMKTTTPLVSEELTGGPLSPMSSAAGSIQVFGYEGGDVNVSCPYDRGFEGRQKYLCNNDCRYADVLITTSQGSSGKYSIHDDKTTRVFTVIISDLHLGDAGKYWCGVTIIGRDINTERKLEVKPDRCCDKVNKIQSIEEGSVTISCPYDSESVDKLKFLCRGNRPSTCRQQAVITSSNTQNGRFRLSDDRKSRIFTVTISSLTLKDSGSYLCGVQRNSGFDDLSAVELEVKEWCCVESKDMSGIVGHAVTFQCPYPRHHRNNMMFLCKGDQRRNCTYITYQGSFTLHNVNATFFSVVITKLKAEDSGTYWCRSDPEWSVGNYTQFHLTVEEEEQRGVSKESIIEALCWLFAALPVLLLILIIILVKVCKPKRRQLKVEAAVDMNTSKLEAADAQDVTSGEDLYQNYDDPAIRSQQKACKEQRSVQFFEDYEDEAQYGNISTTEDIYRNEFFLKTQR
ncbi:polymeric immunoglobulin receptor-like isoform X2 [Xiphophorus couchianus]|uniref:polymeric immunoglobulin receptor-like isoform X2 n=1 Tax=Xiphophorus couchianus TaxID=32473 RepID=UPI00101716DF|nr:polymeric immunoglobulin receptor-like isoform X2 [Xiphophorus couchianus]